jgi:hypothetical protein
MVCQHFEIPKFRIPFQVEEAIFRDLEVFCASTARPGSYLVGIRRSKIHESTMKTAVAFLAIATGASAFAPSATFSKSTAIKATADYDGLIGGDSLETGKKMVSDE